jgi:hypothetical protein
MNYQCEIKMLEACPSVCKLVFIVGNATSYGLITLTDFARLDTGAGVFLK